MMVALTRADLPSPRGNNQLEAPTVRIDPVLRKALLKALNNLEKESDELEGKDGTTEELFMTTTDSEELLEESTTSDRSNLPNVQYTAFTFDRNSSESDQDNTIYKTIIVPKTTLSPPKENKEVVFSEPDPVKEEDIQVESVQLARSVSSNIQANDIIGNKISDKVLALSKSALTSTAAPVTTTPITIQTSSPTTTSTPKLTTTEAPVTNSDGENIERANDVQIHQAPLVAAFTVQQDAQGLPKSVMPIFKQLIDPQPKAPQHLNFALNPYQFALEAKQRELEQRIHYLQAQQRQQEQIYRQQFFYEQRLRADEELRQRERFAQEQRFRQQQLHQPAFRLTQPSRQVPGPVQIFSSVPISPNNGLPVDQQLPIKNAGQFRITNDQQLPFQAAANFLGKDQQIKVQQGPLQLQEQLQLPQRPFTQFNTQVSIVPSISAQLKNNNIEPGHLPPFQGNPLTRVFRQENRPSVSFEQHRSQQIYDPQNAQNLQQLLFGVGGRSNEDLNIITRVLALNHGIQAPLSGNFIGQNGNGVQQ